MRHKYSCMGWIFEKIAILAAAEAGLSYPVVCVRRKYSGDSIIRYLVEVVGIETGGQPVGREVRKLRIVIRCQPLIDKHNQIINIHDTVRRPF